VTPQGRPPTTLHQVLTPAGFHLLLTGPPNAWSTAGVGPDQLRCSRITVHRLAREPQRGALQDTGGQARARSGVVGPGGTSHHLVRPDGHIAYRAAGTDLTGLERYLARWTLSRSTTAG
jgi:hypothetical protein